MSSLSLYIKEGKPMLHRKFSLSGFKSEFMKIDYTAWQGSLPPGGGGAG